MSRMIRVSLAVLSFTCTLLSAQGGAGVKVLLGIGDTVETRWDGSVAVRGGAVTHIEPWRFEPPDSVEGNSWKASTRNIRLFGSGPLARPTQVANGVIVYVDRADDDVELQFKTAQGDFPVRLGDIPYGVSKKLLNNRVLVERVPPYERLTDTPDGGGQGRFNLVGIRRVPAQSTPQ